MVLSLSDEGRTLCDEINRRNDRYYSEVLARVPEERRDSVIRHLALLIDAMTAMGERAAQEEPASAGCKGC